MSIASADTRPVGREPPRVRDASWSEVFSGPFQSSHVFAMPTANVVGAYQLSLAGDASLLTEHETLTTTGLIAIGFGDIAQLEYRTAAAITEDNLEAEETVLDSVGVQLQAPYRAGGWLPSVAVALRLGFDQQWMADSGIEHTHRADDLYFVASWRTSSFALHGGLRVASASIESIGASAPEDRRKTLFLPAAAVEYWVSSQTRLAAEMALVPRFAPGDAADPSEISAGTFGRAGLRWQLHPALIIDASVGYRIELQRVDPAESMSEALVSWDLRVGGEVFVPWGAMSCRALGVFCE